MKKTVMLMLLAAGACLQTARSQVVNRGSQISVSEGAIFFIDDAFNNYSGTILNNGRLIVKKDWQNNDASSTVFNRSSTGVVEFSGDAQLIGGASKTEFPSLSFSGTGLKFLGINMDVTGTLSLNDIELKTDAYTLSVLNSSPDAITRGTGFISTDNKGKLVRIMNSPASYLFPLGSADGGAPVYRPLQVEMTDAVQNTFTASFVKKDPSTEGYSRQSKRPDVETVFEKYFYLIDQNGSSKLNIRFVQNSAEDGILKQLVNWNRFNLWEKAGPSTVAKGSFGDGLDQNILFASNDVITNLPVTLAAIKDEGPFTFFNAFSPDGDGKNDTWEIKNLDQFPNNDLTVFNRWGDEVFKAKSYSSSNAWNGGSLNPGTYYYILNVNVDGVQKSYKGFITMVKKD
ncbi:gliding motility-associated C-terminal domain-containing protein [Flavihumibacter sp. R14]|nr:gliding motility-associated C-terminal domain-containing protein [Flavihumibacter soli]